MTITAADLLELRDGNGYTVREKDGTPSNIIRFRTDMGLRIALAAIAKHLEAAS